MTDERRQARIPHALDVAAAISWRVLIVGLAVAATLWLTIHLRLAVLPAVLAVFASAVFVPPIRWLEVRRVPRALATVLVLVAFFAGLVGLGVLLAPGIEREFGELGPTLEEGVADVRTWLVTGPFNVPPEQLENIGSNVADWFRRNSESLVAGAVSGAAIAFEVGAGAILTLVLTFFFISDGRRIVDWFLGHVPDGHDETARALGRRTWGVIGAYWRGTAIIAFTDAVLIGIGLLVVGVPLVLPLSLLVFVGAFFPLVGATVAGAVAALVALVAGGLVKALIVVGIVIGVQQLEGHILQPFVMGRAMSLHPVVILLALTAGAVTAGVIGAFLAVPTTAALAAAANELRVRASASSGVE